MIFVGFNYGRFKEENGKLKDYCNVFVLEEFGGEQNEDYHFGGQKAVKHGCTSPDVFAGIKPGTKVKVYCDTKKRVCYMVPADKT